MLPFEKGCTKNNHCVQQFVTEEKRLKLLAVSQMERTLMNMTNIVGSRYFPNLNTPSRLVSLCGEKWSSKDVQIGTVISRYCVFFFKQPYIIYHILSSHPTSDAVTQQVMPSRCWLPSGKKTAPTFAMFWPFWAQILLNQPWQWVKEVETCCCCVFKNSWVMIWRIHIILRVGYDPMVMFFISFCARICWCRSHDQSKCPWRPCWFSASQGIAIKTIGVLEANWSSTEWSILLEGYACFFLLKVVHTCISSYSSL